MYIILLTKITIKFVRSFCENSFSRFINTEKYIGKINNIFPQYELIDIIMLKTGGRRRNAKNVLKIEQKNQSQHASKLFFFDEHEDRCQSIKWLCAAAAIF